ncbi:unnamed protein product, partial [Closterium sp. NIES-54]
MDSTHSGRDKASLTDLGSSSPSKSLSSWGTVVTWAAAAAVVAATYPQEQAVYAAVVVAEASLVAAAAAPVAAPGHGLPVRRALLQPVRRALLQPTRRALLPRVSCSAAARTLRPAALRVAPYGCPACRTLLPCASCSAAARASHPAALRVVPYGNPRVALYCSPRVEPFCPTRRALLPRASRPAAPRVTLCCSPCVAPCCPAQPALPNPIRPATRATAAAATRATAFTPYYPRGRTPPSLPAMTSLRCSGGSGDGGGGSSGSGGDRSSSHCGAVRCGVSGGGQMQLQRRPTLMPRQLREWLYQRGTSLSTARCPYVIRTGRRAGASEAAALGARESALLGTAPAEALHTFTLDSGASCCFFRDSTALTPLPAPVAVSLADPSGGPVLAQSTTVLLCPVVPSGSLSGLHLPSFSTNLRAAPHSSSFPPTEAPLQILHMDVWGPARVRGQGGERYFLLVVDDYSRYTTVFPLHTKGEVPAVLILWIRAVRLQLRERFRQDLRVLCLHFDRGGEFSSDLLRAFCQGEGILQSLTLLGSPQQNGVAERRIGLVMEIARTSLIHAASPHFMWPFATSPTLRWTGEVGDASVFRDVTFDKSVPFYCLFPYRTAPLPPPPLFLAPGPPSVDPLPPQGPAPSGVSQVDPLPLAEPVE